MVQVAAENAIDSLCRGSDHAEGTEPLTGEACCLVTSIDGLTMDPSPVICVGSPHVDFVVVLPCLVADPIHPDPRAMVLEQFANLRVDVLDDLQPLVLVRPLTIG